MIAIHKGAEPDGLAELRRETIEAHLSPEDAYKELDKYKNRGLKRRLRESLVREQGQLCAYCMCQIPRGDVPEKIPPIIIEHVMARNPADQQDCNQGLDYNNLVAVCHGNQAERGCHPYGDLTCDAHKKNQKFHKINPVDPATLESIYYDLDGTICSDDPDVQHDLEDILNLNCTSSPLIAERKGALDPIIVEIDKVNDEDIPVYCRTLLAEFCAETTERTPYVGIIIWYLESLIHDLGNVNANQ